MPLKLKVEKSPLIQELVRLFPTAFSHSTGTPCAWISDRAEGYETRAFKAGITIHYAGLDSLVMALGDLMAAGRPFSATKVPPLDFRGIMLDASRNAVVKPGFLKDRLARLALMGLNRFCLYTEETYEVPGEPLFGYARGRYTAAEIKELVAYGKLFGVVLFPCIQTLGHMEHILKYAHYTPLKDNEYVYNLLNPEVYDFISKTIDAARAPYDTDLIHVGMDETFGLGRGLSFKEGEPIYPRRMYVEHVAKVSEMCRAKGLKPMMWGDIVLGHGGATKMGADLTALLPKDMGMDYWDYAWNDPKKYSKELAEFQAMGYAPTVSPGVWSWSRFFPAYHKAEDNIGTLLESAKQAGVKSALNTHWGDDGHECFLDWNLPAHAFFLAQSTEAGNRAAVLKQAKARFAAICGADYDDVVSVQQIDLAGYKPKTLLPYNVGKCFFYDDPAQGLFSGTPGVKPAGDFYAETAKKLAALAKKKGPFQTLFAFAKAFCDFLAVKADLRRRAVAAYKKKDKKAIKAVLADITAATRKLDAVEALYRAYWLEERKAFGLEVILGRMGQLRSRLGYLSHILGEHAAGRMETLEELEFEHFSYFHKARGPDFAPSIWPEYLLHYSYLATRNTIKWW